jgi:LysM repeat protein
MGTYARRSPLRFLAPIALVAFGIAVLMIVSSFNGSSGASSPSANELSKQRDLGLGSGTAQSKPSSGGKLPRKTYKVRSGDTLGSIAEKTGIPVAKLQELNPQLDPQSLVAGQRIKLRE